MRVRQALFPAMALSAFPGRQLPDAILHGKRSLRPHSKAVQRLAVVELSVGEQRKKSNGDKGNRLPILVPLAPQHPYQRPPWKPQAF